jgi:hypothetical protein
MSARHSGAGSGCQGCDPEVPMPTLKDRPFLCAECSRWMELAFAANVAATNTRKTPLELLADRRVTLAAQPETSPVIQ